MKKFYLFLSVAVIFIVVSGSLILTAQTTGNNPIPDDLKVVFKNSCMACHSDEGGGMAKANLNFSKWSTYTPEKQVKKAVAICTAVSKGSMPPKSFVKSHPEVALKEEHKAAICKWSKSMKK